MSGHSKWATIKHKKGMADAKRGQTFSKLAKAITVAVKEGGADPTMNFTLRLQVEKAKAVNMPKDNIERAIARGAGSGGEAELQLVTFEGMAPGGVAVVVEALTDNNNRTFPNVKSYFTKHGGTMDAKVLWMFERKSVVKGKLTGELKEEDEIALIDAGAEDIKLTDGEITIMGAVTDMQSVEAVATTVGVRVESADLEYVAKSTVEVDDEVAERLGRFVEILEDDEDVQAVYTNAV